jgi:hypothetical protein
MNRALAIACFAALTGCPACEDLQSGREYPCSRDAGVEQCAEGWACGIDGRCHSATEGSAIACALDSDCATGWRCGLNGLCHDATVTAAYECASDSDCSGGWRCTCCSQVRTCHAPGIGAPYPCRTAADCEASWSCGPEGLCHDPDAGTPYPCTDDSQCGGGWRCGLEGLCIDWRPEALRPGLYEGPLDESRLNPATLSKPELVSASDFGELPDDVPDAGSFSVFAHGTLTHVVCVPSAASAFAASITLDAGTPRAIAALGARSYFVDDLGLGVMLATPDGGLLQRFAFGGGTTRLRTGSGDAGVFVAGLGDGGVWVLDARSGVSTALPSLTRLDGGSQELFDIAVLPDEPFILAAAEEGVFVSHAWGAWQPAPFFGLPNAQCGDGPDGGDTWRVRGIDAMRGYGGPLNFAFLSERWPGDGGLERFVLGATRLGSCPAQDVAYGCPEPVCAEGEPVTDFNFNNAWCRPADGGSDIYRGLTACPFVTLDPPLAGDSVSGHSGNGYVARADPAGHVAMVGPEVRLFTAPRTSALLRAGTQRWMTSPSALNNTTSDNWFEQPGVGFIPATLGLTEPSALFTQPHYPLPFVPALVFGDHLDQAFAAQGAFSAITGHVYDVSSGALALTATFDVATGTPTSAVIDGQRIIAAFGDRLVAGPIGGTLEVRIAPRAFDPIRSIAFSGGDGYALTGTGLFHVVSVTPQQWTADDVTVPDGERVGVWLDGQAGRLGYSDGTVLALPSRVTLSQPLPSGGPVVQYAQLCGQPIALAHGGLYRLGSNGTWKLEPLPTLGPDRTFDTGRIDVEGDSLLVSTGGGTLVRLAPPMSCP